VFCTVGGAVKNKLVVTSTVTTPLTLISQSWNVETR